MCTQRELAVERLLKQFSSLVQGLMRTLGKRTQDWVDPNILQLYQ